MNPSLPAQAAPPAAQARPVLAHLAFVGLSALALMLMYSALRLALFAYNHELAADTAPAILAEAFLTGLRFDLRLVVVIGAPLLFALASVRAMSARRWQLAWVGAAASLTLFLGLVELDFYREFHQRLNGLVFQYMKEDPGTVMSMLWYGFPVLRYLAAWLLGTWLMLRLFGAADRLTRIPAAGARTPTAHAGVRWLALLLCLAVSVVAARGTLRHGPPMRWGDAYTTDSMFANQLGLNGSLMLATAAKSRLIESGDKVWKASLPQDEATSVVRAMLLTGDDVLVGPERAAVRRDFTPPASGVVPVRHVVVILLESFAGRYVGALGSPDGITPNFDRLAHEGVLFTRFFSNGTHTHQGMFATMACFPNLPGFEYLMQMPEGSHHFSGLPQLLSARGFDDLYVYNGDFSWDNQAGFFSNQGMTRFIGRKDYVAPVVFDPTWGVSDQDMFERAATELAHYGEKPFYALLQTLSNHTPYALPSPLPVAPVTGHGALDEHLTAMRYSDWALGRFFDEARRSPWFKDTLFVILGDHGFGAQEQLTEIDLLRFNVPLLLIGPGMRERFGERRDTVGTQVDVVPTIMGRLGGEVRHQCWGRDLLSLPPEDPGGGVIKPSGSDQTVAIVAGERVLVQPKGMDARLYSYRLGAAPQVERVWDAAEEPNLGRKLQAFVQTATRSLLDDTAGARLAPSD